MAAGRHFNATKSGPNPEGYNTGGTRVPLAKSAMNVP